MIVLVATVRMAEIAAAAEGVPVVAVVEDAGAVAAVIVGAAEGCLLQAVTEGGAVPAERLVRTLLTLALSGA